MLRDELKEMTMKAVDQKEYDEIVGKMKVASKSGKGNIHVAHISDCIIEKLTNEGIFISGMLSLGCDKSYLLSWM